MIALPGADTDDYEEAEERDDLEGDAHVAAGPPPLLDLLSLGSAIPSKLCRIYIVYRWVMSHALCNTFECCHCFFFRIFVVSCKSYANEQTTCRRPRAHRPRCMGCLIWGLANRQSRELRPIPGACWQICWVGPSRLGTSCRFSCPPTLRRACVYEVSLPSVLQGALYEYMYSSQRLR